MTIIASHVAQAVGRQRLLDAERASRQRAQEQVEVNRRLHQVTARLSNALVPAQVAEAILDESTPALHADQVSFWTVSDDGLVYTFTLRNGLVWPDAAPLTVDDVLFTYNLLTADALDASPAPPDALATAKLTKIDARSFRIELAQPFAPLPAYLTTGILPEHLLKNVGVEGIGEALFNTRPVGAGLAPGPLRGRDLTWHLR